MCPAVDSFDFVSDMHWSSAYYSAMAVVSTTAEAVKKKTENIALPLRFWNLARQLRSVADLLEHPHKAKAEESGGEPVDIKKAIEQLDSMLEKLDNFYQICQRYGYTNRTLYGASICSMRRHTETISEFTERVKDILNPATDEIFRRARENRSVRGTVPMSSVF
jgi:hypothetical protein